MGRSFLGKKILVFTAHPDDESYTAAGTIFENHRAGGTTILVCASLGEKGTSHLKKPLMSNQVKQLREKELRAAARFLSISKLYIIGLPDGGISGHRKILLQKGLAIAKRHKPDFILSFGPDGISGHKDHIATGSIARAIARKVEIPFVAFTLPPRLQRSALEWLRARRRARHYANSLLLKKPNLRIAIKARVKKRALRYHASQMDNANAFTGFPPYAVKELLKAEYFIV